MRILSVLILATTGLASSLSAFAGGLPDSGRDAGRDTSKAPLYGTKAQSAVGNGVPLESPFVYRQVGYLATVGPAPLRFGPAVPTCNERTPPRVATTSRKPAATSQTTFQTTPPAEVTPSTATPTTIITGGDAGAGAGGNLDEVINFFRPQEVDTEQQRRKLRFMFDPIQGFQSAPPPASLTPPASAPPSRATYRQN